VVITGLIIVLLLVLAVPFISKTVEENLEPFLFIMGIAAAFISGAMNMELLISALKHPIMIASAVFIAGALFYLLKDPFNKFMEIVFAKVPIPVVVFLVIAFLASFQVLLLQSLPPLSWWKSFLLCPSSGSIRSLSLL
jgi:predicted cation transporter